MPCPYNPDPEIYQKCAEEMYEKPDITVPIELIPNNKTDTEIMFIEIELFFERARNTIIDGFVELMSNVFV